LTKILTSIFVVAGVGTFFLFLGAVGEVFLREKLEEVLAMERIESMKDHVILCGYGRVGRIIAGELREVNGTFVIIEENEEKVRDIIENFDYSVLHDDARKEEVLEKAMITDAEVLITTLADDADNVFVIITAKALNPKLRVISTATKEENRDKLRKIGADEVITPEAIVGKVIARSLAIPSTTSLFDRFELTNMQECCKLAIKPEYAGKKIEDLGIDVLAIVRGDEVLQKSLSKLVLEEGDKIIAVAKKEHK
jgi:voltage-gated potassium channel